MNEFAGATADQEFRERACFALELLEDLEATGLL